MTRDTPKRILAIGQQKWLYKHGISAYDSIQVLIEWSKGFTSTFLTNWIDPDSSTAISQQKIKVIGTKGRFESDQTDRGVQIMSDSGGSELVNPYFCQPYTDIDSGNVVYRDMELKALLNFYRMSIRLLKESALLVILRDDVLLLKARSDEQFFVI